MDNEKILELNDKYQQSQALEEQLNFVEQQIMELSEFGRSLEDFDKVEEKNEFLAALGKGVFVKSEVKDKELFVDVGAGVIVRKNASEAKKVVEQQTFRLQEIRQQIADQIEGLSGQMQELMAEVESSREK